MCLVELDRAVRIMPHDVRTHWNFALGYKDAIKMITSDLANGLWEYKLNEDEWLIVKELVATLKVWFRHNSSCSHVDHVCLIDASLHAGHPNGSKLQKCLCVKSSRKPTRTQHKMAMARMRITKTVQVLESPSRRTAPR